MSAPVTPSEVKAAIADPSSGLCANFKNAILQFPVLIYKIINWLFDSDGNPSTAFRNSANYIYTGDIFPSARAVDVNDATRLLCNGAAVSRSTYAALFAVCGTTYGAGDGSTTFNVPNLVDKFPVGAGGLYTLGSAGGSTTVTMAAGNLIGHTHTFKVPKDTVTDTGQFGFLHESSSDSTASTSAAYSGTTAVGGDPSPDPMIVLNPYLALNYFIKT